MKLQIVVPCFNEEAVLAEAAFQFESIINQLIQAEKISNDSQVTFVDDGSSDRTWQLIEHEVKTKKHVAGIKLSRNSGHQNAVLAGMMSVDGDAVITIDADLQDDLDAIKLMVEEFLAGHEIVYGVRSDRSSDSFFKRTSAIFFYRLLAFFGVEVVHNHADYRLMSRRAINVLQDYKEVNLYLRGIVPLLGFKTTTVEYVRKERFAGESKYPLSKMIKLAVEGITSFSIVPLQLIFKLGLILFSGAMALSAWALFVRLFTDHAVPGWTSTVLPIYLIGGLQLLSLGVIGEYLGKIYSETKSRPRYVIERTIDKSSINKSNLPYLHVIENHVIENRV